MSDRLQGLDHNPLTELRRTSGRDAFAVGDIVVQATDDDAGKVRLAEHGESGRIVGFVARAEKDRADVYTGRRIVAERHRGSAADLGDYLYVASANTVGRGDEVAEGARCIGRCYGRRGDALEMDLYLDAHRPGPDAVGNS